MDSDELINKLFDSLNEIIKHKKDYLTRTTYLSNKLLETLKIIENCINCKDNMNEFHESTNEIENLLAELKKEKRDWKKEDINYKLDDKLIYIDVELYQKVLSCENFKVKKIEKLIDKCGNEEIARFLYDYYYTNTRWILFDELRNIEYLAKGDFGEVDKAIWIDDDNY